MRLRLARTSAVLATAVALAIPATPSFATSTTDPDGEAIAQSVAAASPAEEDASIAPTLGEDGTLLEASIVGGDVSVPVSADGTVTASSDFTGESIGIELPSEFTGAGEPAETGATTYSSASDDLGLAVSVTESGVQLAAVIGSAEAPSDLTYGLNLPSGAQASVQSDGAVLITADDEATLLGGIGIPWATDASGRSLATHYEIVGDTLVQTVETTPETQYPVVADPYLFVDLISSASWVYHTGYGWTLQVAPTGWARANAGSYSVGVYDWNELYSKYKNVGRGIKSNLGGLQDQLICHQQVVAIASPTKSTWNLDEWRADVSYAATVNARCNPGGSVIFD